MDGKLHWTKMKGVMCGGKLDCVWVINFNYFLKGRVKCSDDIYRR